MRDNLVKYNLSYALRYKLDEGIMGNVLGNRKRNCDRYQRRIDSWIREKKRKSKHGGNGKFRSLRYINHNADPRIVPQLSIWSNRRRRPVKLFLREESEQAGERKKKRRREGKRMRELIIDFRKNIGHILTVGNSTSRDRSCVRASALCADWERGERNSKWERKRGKGWDVILGLEIYVREMPTLTARDEI